MQILQNGVTLQSWEIEAECFKSESGCSARYKLNAIDIIRTEDLITRFFGKEYGFYCPNCGKLIQIHTHLIPLHIQRAIDERRKVKHKARKSETINSLAIKKS